MSVFVGVGMCVDVGGWTEMVNLWVIVTDTDMDGDSRNVRVFEDVTSLDKVMVRLLSVSVTRFVAVGDFPGVSVKDGSGELVGVLETETDLLGVKSERLSASESDTE